VLSSVGVCRRLRSLYHGSERVDENNYCRTKSLIHPAVGSEKKIVFHSLTRKEDVAFRFSRCVMPVPAF
jgi:hypothetical protein